MRRACVKLYEARRSRKPLEQLDPAPLWGSRARGRAQEHRGESTLGVVNGAVTGQFARVGAVDDVRGHDAAVYVVAVTGELHSSTHDDLTVEDETTLDTEVAVDYQHTLALIPDDRYVSR